MSLINKNNISKVVYSFGKLYKSYTKDKLKSGDLCMTTHGKIGIILKDLNRRNVICFLNDEDFFDILLDWYNDDLTYKYSRKYNIKMIYAQKLDISILNDKNALRKYMKSPLEILFKQ